jgi:hypothetical protein
LLLVFFISKYGFAQVNTLPNSIGIGNGIDTNVPLHINKPTGEVVRLQGNLPYISFYDQSTPKGFLQGITNGVALGTFASNHAYVYTSGLMRMVVRSDGKVGIGTDTPVTTSLVTIDGKSTEDALTLDSEGSTRLKFKNIYGGIGSLGLSYFEDGNAYISLEAGNSLPIRMQTGGLTRFFISSNGKVGVGIDPFVTTNSHFGIYTNGISENAIRIDNSATTGKAFMSFTRNTKLLGSVGVSEQSDSDLEIIANTGKIKFLTGGSINERMQINSNGSININNALSFNNNFGTSGAILVSNGSTNAPSWVTPQNIAFSAKSSTPQAIPNIAEQSLTFDIENFDDGNSLNLDYFEAPVNGIYNISVHLHLSADDEGDNRFGRFKVFKNTTSGVPYFDFFMTNNAMVKVFASGGVENFGGGAIGSYHYIYEDLYKLNAGDKLYFRVYNNSTDPMNIVDKRIFGHKIY